MVLDLRFPLSPAGYSRPLPARFALSRLLQAVPALSPDQMEPVLLAALGVPVVLQSNSAALLVLLVELAASAHPAMLVGLAVLAALVARVGSSIPKARAQLP